MFSRYVFGMFTFPVFSISLDLKETETFGVNTSVNRVAPRQKLRCPDSPRKRLEFSELFSVNVQDMR